MQNWLETPAGRLAIAQERRWLDQGVADIFGFHALQLGMPELDALRMNRMPHRWLALSDADQALRGPGDAVEAAARGMRRAALVCDFTALPFPENSLDLIVLPHALEVAADPHAALREVGRVLVPEGRVLICGLNPASLWGLRERRANLYRRIGFGEPYLPQGDALIGHFRLRDWLRLLSFEIESAKFGCWQPAVRSERWLSRFQWLDRIGARWWPIFGAVYFISAVKKVRGLRLIAPVWKEARPRAKAAVPVAHRQRVKSRGVARANDDDASVSETH